MNRIKLLIIAIFICMLSLGYLQAKSHYQATEQDAKIFMQTMLDEIYQQLPTKTNNQAKYTYFTEFTTKYFAFAYMSAWSLGSYMKTLDAESKKMYLAISKEYMVFYYGDIFNKNYKLYTFDIYTVKKQGSSYIIKLKANLKRRNSAKSDNEVIDIAWKVKYSQKAQKFYVVDVILNNISFMNLQRSEFQSLYVNTNKDINIFLEQLTQKINLQKSTLGLKIA